MCSFYLSVCISKNYEFILITLNSSTSRMNRIHCSFFLFLLLICNLFLWQGETLLLLYTIYYLSNSSMHVKKFQIWSWWFVPSYFMIFLVVNSYSLKLFEACIEILYFFREDLYLILLVMERLFFSFKNSFLLWQNIHKVYNFNYF